MAYSALEKSSTQQIHGSKLIPSICKPSGFQHVSSRGMCCRDPLSMVSHQVTFGRFVMRTLDVVKRHSKHRFTIQELDDLDVHDWMGKKQLVSWNGDPKFSSFWLDHSFRKSPWHPTLTPGSSKGLQSLRCSMHSSLWHSRHTKSRLSSEKWSSTTPGAGSYKVHKVLSRCLPTGI